MDTPSASLGKDDESLAETDSYGSSLKSRLTSSDQNSDQSGLPE